MIMNILNHSGAIYCFVSDAEILQKIFNKDKVLPQRSIFFNLLKVVKLEGITSPGKDHSNQTDVETSKSLVKPNDLATIIYTSEQQVDQKVMLSHDNIVSDVLNSAFKRIPL
jgi:long-chain acyl-CoA synthetase